MMQHIDQETLDYLKDEIGKENRIDKYTYFHSWAEMEEYFTSNNDMESFMEACDQLADRCCEVVLMLEEAKQSFDQKLFNQWCRYYVTNWVIMKDGSIRYHSSVLQKFHNENVQCNFSYEEIYKLFQSGSYPIPEIKKYTIG